MATPANMEIFWIMILSVVLSMVIGYYSARILHYVFKLDERISYSYSLLCCLPSIGTLPLVLGKAFCFPGGPLEGDSQCGNILGFMMINFLVFQVSLFLIGFNMIAKDANYGNKINDKMSLTWHIVCEKIFKKNYTILHLFRRYFENKKLAEIKFNEFDNKNKLQRIENEITYEYICLDEDEAIDENVEGDLVVNDDYVNKFVEPINKKPAQLKKFKTLKEENKTKPGFNLNLDQNKKNQIAAAKLAQAAKDKEIKPESELQIEDNKDMQSDGEKISLTSRSKEKHYFDSRKQSMNRGENDSIFFSENNEEFKNTNQAYDNIIKLENIIISKSTPRGDESNDFDNPIIKKISPLIIDEINNMKRIYSKESSNLDIGKNIYQSDKYDQLQFGKRNFLCLSREQSIQLEIKKNDALNRSIEEDQEHLHKEINNFLLHKKKTIVMKVKHNDRDVNEFFNIEHLNKDFLNVNKKDLEKKKAQINVQISENEKIAEARVMEHKSIFKDVILRYYIKFLKIIEENVSKNKLQEFLLEKSEIMKNLYDLPPKFPIVRCAEINRDNVGIVDEIWEDYLIAIKKLNPEFGLHSTRMNADIFLVINKIHSPAVVGTILGLFVGISGMRDVLFSTNHYISNLVEGILILTKTTVPLLYISVGISFVTINGINLGIPVTKKHILLSFLVRFLIVPGFGLLWTYIWTNYFGGMIKESKVFRIALFIPFCVPSSANMVVIVNLLKYFIEESNLILVAQNISLLITLTILYLIYFITVGS